MEGRWFSADEIAAWFGARRDRVCPWVERREMSARKAA